MNSTLQFEVTFADVKEIPANPLFSTCKVYVCYAGENQNNSVIPKEVIENAIPTLFNIPIVGRFSEDLDDFVDHGGKIEVTGKGNNKEIKYVHTTKPYGVVPEGANIDWETVGDKEYLVVEGALLWTGRYPEAQKIIDDGKPQSMEVDIVEGRLRKDKKFQVDELIFSALCILGDDIEPAFEDAQIVAFSLNKDTFRQEFSAMMQEIKSSNTEGGNDEVKKNLPLNFTLTSEQLENELKLVLRSQKVTDSWGWEYSRYGFVDYMPEEGTVVAIDWSQDYSYLVGMDFTVSGDLVSVDFDSVKRFKVNYVPMDVNGQPDGDEAVTNGFDGDDDQFTLAVKEHFSAMMEFAKSKKDEVIGDPEKPEVFTNAEGEGETTVEGEQTPEGEGETPAEGETPTQTENFEAQVGDAPTGEAEGSKTLEQVRQDNASHEVGQAPDSLAFTELSKNFTELKESNDAMKAELESLREFKANAESEQRKEAETALFERFSAHLSEEELNQIREHVSEFTLEQLETQMFVLVGKKSATFSAKSQVKSEPTANRMPVFEDSPVKGSDKSYASLIARFGHQ